MCYNNKNHASAYILVVSVVATLALIGSIFLMSSLDERRASEARVETAPAISVADSVVDQIGKALVDDLYINGNNGPYSNDSNWGAYIDYPSPDPAYVYDAHLASYERALADGTNIDAGCWPKVSNLAGYPGELVTNVNPAWKFIPTTDNRAYYSSTMPASNDGITSLPAVNIFGDSNIDTYDCIPLIDTDGDGVRDSLLYPTDSYTGSGVRYHAAVRVIDLSAFININTAFHTQPANFEETWMTVGMVTPANLPMYWPERTTVQPPNWAFADYNGNGSYDSGEEYAPGFAWLDRTSVGWSDVPLGISTYASIDMDVIDGGIVGTTNPVKFPDTAGRGVDCNVSGQTYADYYDDYITRMGNPTQTAAQNFSPFDVSDELACRWMDSVYWTDSSSAANSYYDVDNVSRIGTKNILKSSRLARLLGYTVDDGGEHWAYYGRYLTTMSATRELARYRPMPGAPDYFDNTTAKDSIFFDLNANSTGDDEEILQWYCPAIKVDVNMSLADKTAAFNEYRRAFAWSLGLDEDMDRDEREDIYYRASVLALQLIDYRDGDDKVSYADLSQVGLLNPNTGSVEGCLDLDTSVANVPQKVRGMERHPVISHVWSKVWFNSYDTANSRYTDKRQRLIIAIFNPYSTEINMDDYVLYTGSESVSLSGAGNLPSRDWFIVTNGEPDINIDPYFNSVTFTNLDLEPYGVTTLKVRSEELDGSAGPEIVVSTFDWSQVGGDPESLLIGNTGNVPYSAMKICVRDLSSTEHREFISAYDVASDERESLTHVIALGGDYTDPAPVVFDPAGVNVTNTSFGNLPQCPVLIRNNDLLNLAEFDRLCYYPSGRTYGTEDVSFDTFVDYHSTNLNFADSKDWSRFYINATTMPSSSSVVGEASRMSAYSRLTNYFTIDSPVNDNVDNDGDGVVVSTPGWDSGTMREISVPGKININTAPVAVLSTIPALLNNNKDVPANVRDNEEHRRNLAGLLVSYRDRLEDIDEAGLYNFRINSRNNFISGSGSPREEQGFASAGEVAAVLREYLDRGYRPSNTPELYKYRTETVPADQGPAYESYSNAGIHYDDGYEINVNEPQDDITKYDLPWAYLSNLLTVNSDVYCAYIWIQEGNALDAKGRRYMAIFDRTNCYKIGDMPIVKAFIEVPEK